MIFMNNEKNSSRRNFLRNSSLAFGLGMGGVSIPAISNANPLTGANNGDDIKKLPSEVCVASVDLKELWPDTTRESRIKRILARMEEVVQIKPDIICLPELFDTSWVEEEKPLSELAEDENVPGPVTSRIAAFAKTN